MRTRDVLRYEYIGANIKVVDAKNKSLIGLRGKVVDETKQTFTIEHNNKTKRLLKDQITITCTMNNKTFRVEGALLVGRPEERIKK